MLSSLGLALIVSFVIGTAFVTFVLRAGEGRSDCTIARVLHDAEHPGKAH